MPSFHCGPPCGAPGAAAEPPPAVGIGSSHAGVQGLSRQPRVTQPPQGPCPSYAASMSGRPRGSSSPSPCGIEGDAPARVSLTFASNARHPRAHSEANRPTRREGSQSVHRVGRRSPVSSFCHFRAPPSRRAAGAQSPATGVVLATSLPLDAPPEQVDSAFHWLFAGPPPPGP